MLLVERKMFMYAAHFYSTSILQPSVCVCACYVCVSLSTAYEYCVVEEAVCLPCESTVRGLSAGFTALPLRA